MHLTEKQAQRFGIISAAPKRSKYNARKTEIDGIKFDSQLEARRYAELKIMERRGEIYDLKLQPEFELIPSFCKNGKTHRRTVYRADFSYFEVATDKKIIEDTKGFQTDVYRLKKKLFEYIYPDLEIKEIEK